MLLNWNEPTLMQQHNADDSQIRWIQDAKSIRSIQLPDIYFKNQIQSHLIESIFPPRSAHLFTIAADGTVTGTLR